jgi:hypothetical protein
MSETAPTTPAPPTPSTTTEPTTPPPTTQPTTPDTESKTSLLNDEGAAAEGAPESYSDFTLPEGFEATPEGLAEAKALFKELGLPQANAQRVMDLHAKSVQEAMNAPFKLWQDTQERWVNEVKADPEIGGKLGQVKSTIAKAIDGLGDAKLAKDFREAMDFTGAGNNPAFIRAFFRLAQKVTEGSHVSGSPAGAQDRPRSAAQAMYPNLPSGA